MTATATKMDQLLSRVERMHTSAGVAAQVLQLIEDPDFDLARVATLLETDPALTTQILKLVNSSYFGLARQVASIRQAVACIGTHTLRLALLNYGVLQCLATGLSNSQRAEFVRQALTTAYIAARLTGQPGSRDAAYCAGLIADIGALALLQADSTQYLPLFEDSRATGDQMIAEERLYGFNHAQLGARLLSRWRLPAAMVTAVRQHHTSPATDDSELVFAVRGGVIFAEMLWVPQCRQMAENQRWLRETFDLAVDDLIQFAVDCKQWLSEQARLFDLQLGTSLDADQLRARAMEHFLAESVATAVELDSLTGILDQPDGPF